MGALSALLRRRALRKQLRDWCGVMESPPERKSVLVNLWHDWLHVRLDRRRTTELLEVMFTTSLAGNSPLDPVQLLVESADSDPAKFVAAGPASSQEACSRIMTATDFLHHNIDYVRWPYGRRPTTPESTMRILESRGLKTVAKGEMKSRRPFAWVTKSEEVENLRRVTPTSHLARILRDKLGLLHMFANSLLVEIKYPIASVPSGVLVCPTFIEGCPNIVYRSFNEVDNWGRAIDLTTASAGMPEAVHAPLTFTENFSVAPLGFIDGLQVNFDWADFINSCSTVWVSHNSSVLANTIP